MTVPNTVDTDQDGALTMDEVLAAPQQLKTLDKNGDGEIDWKEMGAWEEQLPLVRDHNITNLIDANGDIHFSSEEIENAPNRLKLLDTNGDWQIDKKEMRISKPPAFPSFSNKKLPYETWRHFKTVEHSKHIPSYMMRVTGALCNKATKPTSWMKTAKEYMNGSIMAILPKPP